MSSKVMTSNRPGRDHIAIEPEIPSPGTSSGPTSGPQSCRPFGVADAMIATAAVAGGLALATEIARHIIERSGRNDDYLKILRYLDRGLTWAFPILACLTLGWVLMRLRRPRPGLVPMARQPGAAAALAAGMVLAPPVLVAVAVAAWGNPHRWVSPLHVAWPKVGPAVAMVWLAMFVSGRRRPERGWIDASGRVLGVVWIATVLLKAPVGPWYPADVTSVDADLYEDFDFLNDPATPAPRKRPRVGTASPPPNPTPVTGQTAR